MSQRRGLGLLLLIVTVLALPSLFNGLQFDDWVIRAAVMQDTSLSPFSSTAWSPFGFLDGDPERIHQLMDLGLLPWWTSSTCKMVFLRPLSGLTHQLDFALWPNVPFLMHLHSIVWLLVLVVLVWMLYHRLFTQNWPAYLAALATVMFAVDDANAMPIGWIANRNALVAAVFSVASLVTFVQWRQGRNKLALIASPIFLGCALLSKESALAIVAYLFCYVWLLDQGRLRWRLANLVPHAAVTICWYLWYRSAGGGVSDSGIYVDPASEPLQWLGSILSKGPILLLGKLGVPPADSTLFHSPLLLSVHWIVACVFLILLAWTIIPLIRRDRLARFWTASAMMTLPLACMLFPQDRLMLLAGLGTMALAAQVMAAAVTRESWFTDHRWRSPLLYVMAFYFFAVHLVFSPAGMPIAVAGVRLAEEDTDSRLTFEPGALDHPYRRVILVNGVSPILNVSWKHERQYAGLPVPEQLLNLSPGYRPVCLERVDENAVAVRPVGGYLLPYDWTMQKALDAGLVSLAYHGPALDLLFRSPEDLFPVNATIPLTGVTVRVSRLTRDGRPAEATFIFDTSVEASELAWFVMGGDGYERFNLPEVGETVYIPFPDIEIQSTDEEPPCLAN